LVWRVLRPRPHRGVPPFLERLGNGRFGSSSSPDLQYPAHFLKHSPWLVVAIVSKAL
jgi:hypothetical protein